RNSKDLTLKYKLMPLLNKFAGKIEKSEEFILSTTIQHVIGVRNGSDDKMILAGAATESIIQTIFSPDEQISKAGSKALGDLIEENTEIRKSLLTTGFIQIVQQELPSEVLTHSIQSSSSSSSSLQKETNVPNHVRNNLLDQLLKLAVSAEDLQPLSILIPILERIKTDGEPELKNKAKRILGMIASEGISSLSDTKEKDEKIHQLEEENKRKDEENKKMQEEYKKLKDENQKIKEYFQNEKEKQIQKEKEAEEQIKKLQEEQKKQNEKSIIAIINQDPTKIDVTDINEGMKKIIKKQYDGQWYTFSLTQVLENGVWSLEAQFSNLIGRAVVIGIVRDSHNITANQHPTNSPYNQHMAVIGNKKWTSDIWYKGARTPGNQGFDNNEIVRLEFDSEKGTLTFFLNDVQQPVYISGIKEKV
ncbi:MAG: hypothetical protein EZS28_042566, partial [Streblomastix strix]